MSDQGTNPICPTSPRLTLNASGGGATISQTCEFDVRAGANAFSVDLVPRGTAPGDVDVIAPGSFSLQRVEVPAARSTEFWAGLRQQLAGQQRTRLVVNAPRPLTSATGTIVAAWPAEVRIDHRLTVGPDGRSAMVTMATITNNSTEPLTGVDAVVVAGDTRNTVGPREGAARSAPVAAGVPTRITSENATVRTFRLQEPLTLAPGRTISVNLFGTGFEAAYRRDLTLTSWGNYSADDARVGEAGQVNTIYTLANTRENGIGVPLPAGPVNIRTPDGTLLSQTSIGNVSEGRPIELQGGTAFDITASRKQTFLSAVDQGAPTARGRGEVEVKQKVTARQEITINNTGSRAEVVRLVERGIRGENVVVRSVLVNGVPREGVQFSTDNGTITLEGIEVPANGRAVVSFEVEYVRTEIRQQR